MLRLLVALMVSWGSVAHAELKEWKVAITPAYGIAYVDSRTANGGGGGVEIGFGITEALSLHASGFVSWHAIDGTKTQEAGTITAYASMLGLTYTLDVIRLVPYFELQLGVVGTRGTPGFGDNPKVLARQQDYFLNAAKRARLSWAFRSRLLMVANMLFKPTVLVCSAALLRKSAVEKVGGFDEELRLVEDVDFYLRAIRECGVVFLDRVVLNYRTGAPSLMHDQRDSTGAIRAYGRIFSKYRERHGAAELMALKLLARTALRWT